MRFEARQSVSNQSPMSLGTVVRHFVAAGCGFVACSTFFSLVRFESFKALLISAAILSLLHVIARPILVRILFPFLILSLGVGYFVINTVLLFLACRPSFGATVKSFWSALFSSMIIAIMHSVLCGILPPDHIQSSLAGSSTREHGPVIDI